MPCPLSYLSCPNNFIFLRMPSDSLWTTLASALHVPRARWCTYLVFLMSVSFNNGSPVGLWGVGGAILHCTDMPLILWWLPRWPLSLDNPGVCLLMCLILCDWTLLDGGWKWHLDLAEEKEFRQIITNYCDKQVTLSIRKSQVVWDSWGSMKGIRMNKSISWR